MHMSYTELNRNNHIVNAEKYLLLLSFPQELHSDIPNSMKLYGLNFPNGDLRLTRVTTYSGSDQLWKGGKKILIFLSGTKVSFQISQKRS